jgi:hypothetical protein
MTRAITALHYTAAALVLGWLVVASLGWLDAGIWCLAAAVALYTAVLALCAVEAAVAYLRPRLGGARLL